MLWLKFVTNLNDFTGLQVTVGHWTMGDENLSNEIPTVVRHYIQPFFYIYVQ